MNLSFEQNLLVLGYFVTVIIATEKEGNGSISTISSLVSLDCQKEGKIKPNRKRKDIHLGLG